MTTSTFIIGLILILIGEIAFLANLGYISWGFFYQASKLWPVVIILIGLGFILGNRIPRWLAFGITITLAILIGVYAWASPNPAPYIGNQSNLIIEEAQYSDVTNGNLSIKFGGGTFSIGLTNNYLVDGFFDGIEATSVTQQMGNLLNINLRQSPISIGPGINNIVNNWDIKLSPQLSWDVSIEAGAVKGDIDLTDIPLNNLHLKLGAGDVFLALGNNGEHSTINVEAGASDIKIQVPEDLGVKIKQNSALSNNNLNNLGWQRIDKYYISPGYDEAASKIDLELNLGVANFQLEVI